MNHLLEAAPQAIPVGSRVRVARRWRPPAQLAGGGISAVNALVRVEAVSAPWDHDAEDVRRIAGGDQEAENALSRRLLPRLRVWAIRNVGQGPSASIVDDVVSDVLLTVLRAAREGRIAQPQAFSAFVLQTCRRVAKGRQATEARREGLLRSEHTDEVAFQHPRLDHARLRDCLEGLTPRAQAVVALSFFAEEEPEAIARAVDATLGSVRVMRHRALHALHDCLTGARP